MVGQLVQTRWWYESGERAFGDDARVRTALGCAGPRDPDAKIHDGSRG